MVGKVIVKMVKYLLILFAIGFTAAFAFWFGQTLYLTFWDIPHEVEVPNLIGEDAIVASNKLKEKGLVLTITDSRYQDRYAANTIIKQDPPGGIMARQGREVLAIISLGPEMTDVPDLMGLSIRDSQVLLSNSKLRLGNVAKTKRAFKEPGEILNQNPKAGEKVRRGSEVNIQINEGDEPMVKVPNLIGSKHTDVENTLKKNNLLLGTIVWVWQDYIPKGEVIRQIPNPGSMAQPRTAVEVKISAGQRGLDLNLKQKDLVIFAPKGEGLQTIKVRQVDSLGNKVIYEGQHAPGGRISLTINSWGDTEIQIYHNTKMANRMRF